VGGVQDFLCLHVVSFDVRHLQLNVKSPKLQENYLPVRQKHLHRRQTNLPIREKHPTRQMNQPEEQLKLSGHPDKKPGRASK
jgi:hypothetical protein